MDDTPDTFVRRRPMLLPRRLGELLLLLRSFEGRIPFLDVCYVEIIVSSCLVLDNFCVHVESMRLYVRFRLKLNL